MLLDDAVKTSVRASCLAPEKHLIGDVAFYYGPIEVGALKIFRDFIEKLSQQSTCNRQLLFFFLNSPGGSAEAAEKNGRNNETSLFGGLICRSGHGIFSRHHIVHVG